MKQKNFLKFSIFSLLIFFAIQGNAQTTLTAGDIAITSANADNSDEFSFILLKDIVTGTEIYFTENGYNNTTNNWRGTTEGSLKWTSTSSMLAGTQVQVITPGTTVSVNEGTIINNGSSWGFSGTGDSIIIYQGTGFPNDTSEVTNYIWVFNTGTAGFTTNATATTTTGIPPGLTDGTNAIDFAGNTDDNFFYNCNVSTTNNIATLRTALATEANFTSGFANEDYKAPTLCFGIATWLGTTSDWATATNWFNGVLPNNFSNVDIPELATAPIINGTTAALAGNLNVTEADGINISAGGSLIVSGTSSGNVTYNRTLTFISGNTEGWHLVASPVGGETYNNAFGNDNNLAASGTRRGLATYTTGSDSWSYLENDDSNASAFNSGLGYSLKRASTGTVSFTGTINTSDAGVNAPVLIGGTGGFNLLGVPYTSYINSATFLTDNTGNLVSETIWLWNPTTKNYETKVTVDGFILAPGQGFFARASSATNLNFAEINQTGNADTFQKSSKTEIKILMNDGESDRFTKIYYLPNATKGFDNGYDGETFGGQPNTTDIFTQLLAENVGKKYQVQSIPNSDYEEMIIPVGITADAGKEITFTADAQNLPSGINVYLEDRQLNTFTRLDEANANYKVTLADASNGTGRFYMHTASKALSTDSEILTSVSIYKTNNSNLRVAGLQNGNASVKIFNILGKKVLQKSFTANGPENITLPNLASGIYIVQLQNEAGSLSKKIILE